MRYMKIQNYLNSLLQMDSTNQGVFCNVTETCFAFTEMRHQMPNVSSFSAFASFTRPSDIYILSFRDNFRKAMI
jgi:hypothetical protein